MHVDQFLVLELQSGEHGYQCVDDREEHGAHTSEEEGVRVQGNHPLGVVEDHIEPHISLDEPGDAAHDKAEHGPEHKFHRRRHLHRAGLPDSHKRDEYGEPHGEVLPPGDELPGEQFHPHGLGGIPQQVMAPNAHGDQQVDHDDGLDHVGSVEGTPGEQRYQEVPHSGGVDEGVAVRHHIQPPPVDILEDERIHRQGVKRIAKEGKETIDKNEHACGKEDNGVDDGINGAAGNRHDEYRHAVVIHVDGFFILFAEQLHQTGDAKGSAQELTESIRTLAVFAQDGLEDVIGEEEDIDHDGGGTEHEEDAAEYGYTVKGNWQRPVKGVERVEETEEAGCPAHHHPDDLQPEVGDHQFGVLDRFLDEEGHEEIECTEDSHIDKAVNAHDGVRGEHGVIQFGGRRFNITRANRVEEGFHAVQRVDIVLLGAHEHAFES